MIYQIFITNFENQVFVCIPKGKFLSKESLLLEANSIEEGLTKLELLYGCIKEKLKLYEVYSSYMISNGNPIEVKGFILKLNYKSNYCEHLFKCQNHKFINYEDLFDFLNDFYLKEDVKESVINLIEGLSIFSSQSSALSSSKYS